MEPTIPDGGGGGDIFSHLFSLAAMNPITQGFLLFVSDVIPQWIEYARRRT